MESDKYFNDSDLDTCAICFEMTSNGVVPCGHLMCENCIAKWYEKRKCLKCPVCRRIIHSFASSTVYDSDLILFCEKKQKFGLTLASCSEGVVVKSVMKNHVAHNSGVKKNMIFTHINGIPATGHENAIMILDSSKIYGCNVYIKTKEKKSEYSFFKKYFCFKPR